MSLLITALAVCSCGKNNKEFYQSPLAKKNLRLRKVNTFIIHDTTNTGYTIGKLRYTFATNTDHDLHAFYDAIKRRIIIVNNQGVIQHVIGHEGRGPDELVNVTSFNFNKQDQVVLYDQSQRLIKVFNMADSVLHSAKQHKNSYPLAKERMYIHHNKIYAATANIKDLGDLSNLRKNIVHSKVAAVYNYDGELVDTLGEYDPSVINNKGPNPFSNITIDKKRNQLLSTQAYNYRIQIFNLKNGKRIAWFGHKPKHFNAGNSFISPHLPKRKKRKMVEGLTSPKGAFSTQNYIIFEFEKLTKAFLDTRNFSKKEAYVAIYDRNMHAYYGEIKLPYILGNVAGNKLYFIENSNPDQFTVGVYKIRQGS